MGYNMSVNGKKNYPVFPTINDKLEEYSNRAMLGEFLTENNVNEYTLLTSARDVLFMSMCSQVRSENPEARDDVFSELVKERYSTFTNAFVYDRRKRPETFVKDLLTRAIKQGIVDRDFINSSDYSPAMKEAIRCKVIDLRNTCGISPEDFFNVNGVGRQMPRLPSQNDDYQNEYFANSQFN